MLPLAISALATLNPTGLGTQATFDALWQGRSGLRSNDFTLAPLNTWIGRVDGLEACGVEPPWSEFDCRNNRLAQAGLRQDDFEQAVARARDRYGAGRIAVVMGTTTSGILETELAYRQRDAAGALPPALRYRSAMSLSSLAEFVRGYLQLHGPAAVISTACSSSAKVFCSAARYIEAGLCDAAVVGGVDSLCLSTLYGFHSLELLSPVRCRPFGAARNGISIGEAAGFVLLEPATGARDEVQLNGYGESSDAYHMSSPHPHGEGAFCAMQAALGRAGIAPSEIDYINAHGTATPANDKAEDLAIFRLFGNSVPVSSTKSWTGHTLGAAGVLEAIITCLCLQRGFVPGMVHSETLDDELRTHLIRENESHALRYALSNSFGFGGNNCSLVFSRRDAA